MLNPLRTPPRSAAGLLAGLAALVIVLLLPAAPIAAQTISTVAGGGPLEGAGAQVAMDAPTALVTDGAGNVFIGAPGRVYRWDRATDSTTVVAGTGACCTDGGDGGAATTATLAMVEGLAVAVGGDVYISTGTRVRKVSAATGIITTVAGTGSATYGGDGGPATSAGIDAQGIAIDAAGVLYIADTGHHRVRRVAAATQVITTIAGTGSSGFSGDGGAATAARLNRPADVTIHPSGHLVISDRFNNRLRRVHATSGVITTVAGNGTCGALNDGSPALGAAVCNPEGIAVNAAGDIFLGTFARVRRIDGATSVITTIVGDGTGGGTGDGGPAASARVGFVPDVAVDPLANLFLGDSSRNRVRRVDAATAIITTVVGGGVRDDGPATAATGVLPQGIAIDANGHLFIASANDHRIRRVDAITGTITTVAGNGSCGFAGDGGVASAARLCTPQSLAFDAAGTLYVADSGNAHVRAIDAATGHMATVAGNGETQSTGDGGAATSAAVVPQGLVVHPGGSLYISDKAHHRIRKVDLSTGIITTVAGTGVSGFAGDGGAATSANLASPQGLALDADGHLFIADYSNDRVRRVDAATGVITTVAGDGTHNVTTDGVLATTTGIGLTPSVAIAAGGHVLLGDGFSRVRRVDATTGLISTIAGTGVWGFSGDGGLPTSAQLTDVVAFAFSGTDLYLADASNFRVRRVSTSGIGPTSWTVQAAGGSTDIAVGNTGGAPWTAVAGDAWLSVDVAGGTGSGTVTLTAEAYTGAVPRTGSVTIAGQAVAVLQLPDPPRLSVDRAGLSFGAVRVGSSFASQTPAQVLRLTESGAVTVPWTATSSASWLHVSPASGSTTADLSVSVSYVAGLPTSGTVHATIAIASTGGTPLAPVPVQLTISTATGVTPPFGVIDTPVDNATGVVGAVAFTGWALDDLEVTGVAICRAAVTGETAPLDPRCANTTKFYVGDAVFIEGARPDVEAAYPSHPYNTRGGWGFMVLTNMLPHVANGTPAGGTGTFTFTFYARDLDGHTTTLGARTITCSNATSILPFGTIDTPGQGATATGAAYANFGWALTPQPKHIPDDGSTIRTFIDGVNVGHPAYGYARADIQSLFPGYSNTDSSVGVRILDTTALTSGLHTVSWAVCDDAAACTGIGSRYFRVSNTPGDAATRSRASARAARSPTIQARTGVTLEAADVLALPADTWPVQGRRGWDEATALAPLDVAASGTTLLAGEELDRLELDLAPEIGETVAGYVRAGRQLRPLPVGATLDARTGRFTWAPGVGFVGRYDLVFVRTRDGRPVGRRDVRVRLVPKRAGHVGAQAGVVAPATRRR
jgi:hypothetical protein